MRSPVRGGGTRFQTGATVAPAVEKEGKGKGRMRIGAQRLRGTLEARLSRVPRLRSARGGWYVGTPALAGVPSAQPAVARYLARRGSGRRAELQQFGDQGLAALGQLEAVGVEDAALLAPGQASDV